MSPIQHHPTIMSTTIIMLTMNIQPVRHPMPTSTLQHPHMDTIKQQRSPPIMGPAVSMTTMQKKLVLYTMSLFGNRSAQRITGTRVFFFYCNHSKSIEKRVIILTAIPP